MSKIRLAIIASGFVVAVAVFILTSAIDELSIVSDGVQLQDAGGGWRPLTRAEMWRDARRAALNSVPCATISATSLLGVTGICSRWLRRLTLGSAVLHGLALGAACGIASSMAVWTIFGGWGPPFLCPSVLAGSIIAVSVGIALSRRRST